MGKFSTQDKVCVLLFCALMRTSGAPKQLFFPISSEVTWDEARSRCQACFKDLVTLTPDNSQIIAQNVSSDSWVGLRKNFTSMGNSNVFWTHWANGDPLSFQNWLPGQPVLKSQFPKMHCCSCSCTCPASFTTRYTTPPQTNNHSMLTNSSLRTNSSQAGTYSAAPVATTASPVAAECVRTSVELPDDDNYIEDACVVMLSFGAWVERKCSELLSYVCYDDVFDGEAQVNKITSASAAITWMRVPGNITHYRVEVRIGKQTGQRSSSTRDAVAGNVTTNVTTTNLNYDLDNLTAGSHYSVQVFAVKCGRDLNPQENAFYTIPHRVKNLNVAHVTDTSISLSWEKPDGNADIYRIESQSLPNPLEVETKGVEIPKLVPGNLYSFRVYTGVKDGSTLSNESPISAYTKPQKVSNLMVSENNDNSMTLNWDLLAGEASGFRISVSWNDLVNRTIEVGQNVRQHKVKNLPSATEITLGVRALANNSAVEGEESTVVNHTAPEMTPRLSLKTTATTLTATWEVLQGHDFSFDVELWLDGKLEKTERTSNTTQHFKELKTAAMYTVFVYSVSGHHRSEPAKKSEFTLPGKPASVRAKNENKNQITFEWNPPENAGTSAYHVRLTSVFWGQTWDYSLENKTTFTFGRLTSGTRYNFEVRATAGHLKSEAASLSHCTENDEREVFLSMMCSSETPLFCDQDETRASVFDQLESHFRKLLGDSVAWKLEKLERANA